MLVMLLSGDVETNPGPFATHEGLYTFQFTDKKVCEKFQ